MIPNWRADILHRNKVTQRLPLFAREQIAPAVGCEEVRVGAEAARANIIDYPDKLTSVV